MPSTLPPGVPEDAPSIRDGRYVLVARIGEGGMAGVYRTWDSRLRVWRAVKVLFPDYAKRRKLRARFESEAHTMARLEHPNLCRIYDVGDAGPLPYIVMELVTGGTLIHWLARNGPMSPRMATEVILQVCQGVAEAHAAGVVHRDIKPHNVLIHASGQCKLTDFGIAQEETSDLTKTGSTMGTLGYMAPEQRADAKSVDVRADIFSLGATLWTLLAGEPANDLVIAHENSRMLEAVPEAVRPVFLKCVAYDRDERYPDVHALFAALEAARAQLPEDPPYTPDLVMDLTEEEEPIENTPAFPEIRAILDGTSELPSDDGALSPPASQKKALPYFMPAADTEARRRAITSTRSTSDDDLPDYIDRSSLDRGEDQLVIGVDSAHVRDEEEPPPTRDEEQGEEVPDYLDAETDPEPQRPIEPVIAPEPVPPPAPPADDEPSPLARIAGLASIPIGLFLAFATLMVVVLMLIFGYNAYTLYGAATVATASRQKLYTVLDTDRAVIDQLATLGGDRIALEDAWLGWQEERGEPDRYDAAERYLAELDRQASALLAGEGSAAQREVEHVVRRIRSAHMQYESNAETWDQHASSLIGRFLVAVGAGSAPPK